MATLTTIGNVASAMGQAVEKASKVRGFCYAFIFFSSWYFSFAVCYIDLIATVYPGYSV